MPFDNAKTQDTEASENPNLQILLYKISTSGFLEDYGIEGDTNLNTLKGDAARLILSIMESSKDCSIKSIADSYEDKSDLSNDDFKKIFSTYHAAGKPAVSSPLAQALDGKNKLQGGGR